MCSSPVVPEMWEINQPPGQRATEGAVSLGKKLPVRPEDKSDIRKKGFCLYTEFQRHRGRILRSGNEWERESVKMYSSQK